MGTPGLRGMSPQGAAVTPGVLLSCEPGPCAQPWALCPHQEQREDAGPRRRPLGTWPLTALPLPHTAGPHAGAGVGVGVRSCLGEAQQALREAAAEMGRAGGSGAPGSRRASEPERMCRRLPGAQAWCLDSTCGNLRPFCFPQGHRR